MALDKRRRCAAFPVLGALITDKEEKEDALDDFSDTVGFVGDRHGREYRREFNSSAVIAGRSRFVIQVYIRATIRSGLSSTGRSGKGRRPYFYFQFRDRKNPASSCPQ
jgi:hypothetical protein